MCFHFFLKGKSTKIFGNRSLDPKSSESRHSLHDGVWPRMAYGTGSYDGLRRLSSQVLEVFLENSSEESTESFLQFLINHHLPDGTHIEDWLQSQIAPEHLKRQVLMGFAQWIHLSVQRLDRLVPLQTEALTSCHNKLTNYINAIQATQASEIQQDIMSDFIHHVVLRLLGNQFSCFASALAQLPVNVNSNSCVEHPAELLANLVQHLERCRAKVIQVALELAPLPRSEVGSFLKMQFCRYFTVELETTFQDSQATKSTKIPHPHRLIEHETEVLVPRDLIQGSPFFSIHLIDSYGSLLRFLQHLESVSHQPGFMVAVDFEGVKLNRSGQLCLLQMTCSDMPSVVYVVDVYVLPQALHLKSPKSSRGISLQTILEDQRILKLWFDPRNDVDALFHQFQIRPQHVFDLQLAEVAGRRSKGLQVHFVPSLQKCVAGCDRLDCRQKQFADFINRSGKQLFEPDHGGSYEVFQKRPLLDDLLVYAAHDCRYMHMLYQCYCAELSDEWEQRVLSASNLRAQWFLHPTYQRPSTDAPNF